MTAHSSLPEGSSLSRPGQGASQRLARTVKVAMVRYLIERRLREVSQRLRRARGELAVVDEQLRALSETAEEARTRSLVSETPLAAKEYHEAQRHADAMDGARQSLIGQVRRLEAEMDDLLNKL